MTEPENEGPMPIPEAAAAQRILEATRTSAHAECLFCGRQNPIGFKLAFRAQGDGSVHAVFACERLLQSYPEHLHGGVVAALLDAAMTNCLFSMGVVAVTAEMTVRFLTPAKLDRPAEVTAAVTRARGPLYYLKAELAQDQKVTAWAAATFMKRGRKSPGGASTRSGPKPDPSRQRRSVRSGT